MPIAEEEPQNPPSNPAEPDPAEPAAAAPPQVDADILVDAGYQPPHPTIVTNVNPYDPNERRVVTAVTVVDSSDDGTAAGAIHLSYIHCIELSVACPRVPMGVAGAPV